MKFRPLHDRVVDKRADSVWFDRRAGADVEIDGVELLIIIGIVEKTEAAAVEGS